VKLGSQLSKTLELERSSQSERGAFGESAPGLVLEKIRKDQSYGRGRWLLLYSSYQLRHELHRAQYTAVFHEWSGATASIRPPIILPVRRYGVDGIFV